MADKTGEPTCGKGLAENSWLPAKLSELTGAMAEVLAHHMTALDRNAENGREEYDAYDSLVNRYRDLAVRLAATASEMEGYRDLRMADHDMSVMTSPESLAVFERFVQAKQELRSMLDKTQAEDMTLLSQMRDQN